MKKLQDLVTKLLLKYPFVWPTSIAINIIIIAVCNGLCFSYGFVPKLAWFLCLTSISSLFIFGNSVMIITNNPNTNNRMGGLYKDGKLLYPPAEVAERLVRLTIKLRQKEGTSHTQFEWDKTMTLMSNMMNPYPVSIVKKWATMLGDLDTILENSPKYNTDGYNKVIEEKKQEINTLFGYPNESSSNSL